MSETVHYKGKLIHQPKLNGETLEEQCERILGLSTLPNWYNSYAENLMFENKVDEFEYYSNDGELYIIEYTHIDSYCDIFEAKFNSNREIEFDVKYYNGGCGLTEALDIALQYSGLDNINA